MCIKMWKEFTIASAGQSGKMNKCIFVVGGTMLTEYCEDERGSPSSAYSGLNEEEEEDRVADRHSLQQRHRRFADVGNNGRGPELGPEIGQPEPARHRDGNSLCRYAADLGPQRDVRIFRHHNVDAA